MYTHTYISPAGSSYLPLSRSRCMKLRHTREKVKHSCSAAHPAEAQCDAARHGTKDIIRGSDARCRLGVGAESIVIHRVRATTCLPGETCVHNRWYRALSPRERRSSSLRRRERERESTGPWPVGDANTRAKISRMQHLEHAIKHACSPLLLARLPACTRAPAPLRTSSRRNRESAHRGLPLQYTFGECVSRSRYSLGSLGSLVYNGM